MRKPGDTGKLTMQKMMQNCADAARRTAELRGAKVSPGPPERFCRALIALKYPYGKIKVESEVAFPG